jgi:RNA polymerase sigma-70 factor (ECF subfamily)
VAIFRLPDPAQAPTDQELIDRTLGGDGHAYGMLVERYQRKVYRVAYAIVRNEVEADTITQDVFVQAYTHLGRFEGRAGFETWLTRIAINRSRDSLRRRKFVSLFVSRGDEEESEAMIEPVDERPDPERQLMSGQLRVAIQRAETKLSSQQKTIFRLRHYENLSLEEIADHLGLRAGTVRAHLFRAIHKIRQELSSWRTARAIQETDHEPALQ